MKIQGIEKKGVIILNHGVLSAYVLETVYQIPLYYTHLVTGHSIFTFSQYLYKCACANWDKLNMYFWHKQHDKFIYVVTETTDTEEQTHIILDFILGNNKVITTQTEGFTEK